MPPEAKPFVFANRHRTLILTYGSLSAEGLQFPYLLVNIGSGISIIRVEGDGKFDRVSGSTLGGGTFWGLCRLLTGCRNFDEMLELSARGDNAKVVSHFLKMTKDRNFSLCTSITIRVFVSYGNYDHYFCGVHESFLKP